MFFVLSKKKVSSYLIALGTVAILLATAGFESNEKLLETSANIVENQQINNEEIENKETNNINYHPGEIS